MQQQVPSGVQVVAQQTPVLTQNPSAQSENQPSVSQAKPQSSVPQPSQPAPSQAAQPPNTIVPNPAVQSASQQIKTAACASLEEQADQLAGKAVDAGKAVEEPAGENLAATARQAEEPDSSSDSDEFKLPQHDLTGAGKAVEKPAGKAVEEPAGVEGQAVEHVGQNGQNAKEAEGPVKQTESNTSQLGSERGGTQSGAEQLDASGAARVSPETGRKSAQTVVDEEIEQADKDENKDSCDEGLMVVDEDSDV